MEELKIYKYQAESILTALQGASRILESKKIESCIDRDINQARLMIEQVIKEEPDNFVTRFGKVERK